MKHCYTPVSKVCNGSGPDECKTLYESSCTTKYEEIQPARFVGDTACERLPVEICGPGCEFEEGEEECHDKVVASVVEVPEEVCDLNPQKICHFVTKLVPELEPVEQCTVVPKETCQLKFSKPSAVKTPLITKWCLDESDLEEEETGRFNHGPTLDTRRVLPANLIKRVENESEKQVAKAPRKPRVGKLIDTFNYVSDEDANQETFQTTF